MTRWALPVVGLVLMGGCAASYAPDPLARDHPANPEAPQATRPDVSEMLGAKRRTPMRTESPSADSRSSNAEPKERDPE